MGFNSAFKGLMQLAFPRHLFKKEFSNIKFHENPSSESRTVAWDGRKDVTKLIVAFRNFANAPKNSAYLSRNT